YNESGIPSPDVLKLAIQNASLQTGLTNALDEAILKDQTADLTSIQKLAEIPFDFTRKRVSVILRSTQNIRIIMKGAFHHVLEVCSLSSDGSALDANKQGALERLYMECSSKGIRVIAVATRELTTPG